MAAFNPKIIRESFDLARPHALRIVARFYEILWQDYPSSKSLFSSADMVQQKNALVGSLAYIVAHLESGETLQKYLRQMGGRHVQYGVTDEHYEMVGASLLKTFGEAFGDTWSRDIADQWSMAISLIVRHMKEGAQQVNPVSPEKEKVQEVISTTTRRSDANKIELPNEIRQEIRVQVRSALQELIQEEIQLCIEEELKSLRGSNVYELLRKRA